MSTSQVHGDEFADFMRAGFRRSADRYRSNTQSVIDIESEFDKIRFLPTSIKVSGNGGLALADARRFWSHKNDYRILLGKWTQMGNDKRFGSLIEFIVTGDEHKQLLGDVTLEEVSWYHDALTEFEEGVRNANLARQFVEEVKPFFSGRSIVTLNAKIDDKKQRRLQCSITEKRLRANINEWEEFKNYYKGIKLGFEFYSTPREFRLNE